MLKTYFHHAIQKPLPSLDLFPLWSILTSSIVVSLRRRLDEMHGLRVRDPLLQLELNQGENLERHERVHERLAAVAASVLEKELH